MCEAFVPITLLSLLNTAAGALCDVETPSKILLLDYCGDRVFEADAMEALLMEKVVM